MLKVFAGLAMMVGLASASAAQPRQSRDQRDLLTVERAWNDAVVKRDGAALNRILVDDFVLIWIDGSVSRKADLIAAVAKRKAEINPFETEDVLIRVYGDTAIITGRFSQTARLGDRQETNSFRYTDVYRRTSRGWRAVSAHASLLKRGS